MHGKQSFEEKMKETFIQHGLTIENPKRERCLLSWTECMAMAGREHSPFRRNWRDKLPQMQTVRNIPINRSQLSCPIPVKLDTDYCAALIPLPPFSVLCFIGVNIFRHSIFYCWYRNGPEKNDPCLQFKMEVCLARWNIDQHMIVIGFPVIHEKM